MKFTIITLLLVSCIGIIQSASVHVSDDFDNYGPVMQKDEKRIANDINQIVGKMSAQTWEIKASKMLISIKKMVKSFQHMCSDLSGFVEYIRGVEKKSTGFAKDVPVEILQNIDHDISGLSKTFGSFVNVMANLMTLIYDMKAHISPTENTYAFTENNRQQLLGYIRILGNLTNDISLRLHKITKDISVIVKAIEANFPNEEQSELLVRLEAVILKMTKNYQEIAADANDIETVLQEAFAVKPMTTVKLSHSKLSNAIDEEVGSAMRLFMKVGIFALKLTSDMTDLERAVSVNPSQQQQVESSKPKSKSS